MRFDMDHVAIMNPKIGAIERILGGEKKIETRWYKNKIAPWNKIRAGDKIYFKYSGKMVTIRATVERVMQLEINNINQVKEIIDKFKQIDIINTDYLRWARGKRYGILIWLKDAQAVKPFGIDKTGFGAAAAWMCVNNIKKVMLI